VADASDFQRDLVRSMFEQHWLHARHVENERLLVVNVFALIFGGSIAAYKESFFSSAALADHVFLMLLALFGVLFSIKIDAIFKGHTQLAQSLLERWGLPSMLENLVSQHWVNRRLRISRLFMSFFSLCFCFLGGILLKDWLRGFPCVVLLAWVVPFVAFFFSLWLFDRLAYDAPRREYPETFRGQPSAAPPL
jgi:hypothetical protein